MTEFGKYFILYGYILPSLIVSLLLLWNFHTNCKVYSKDFLLLLIPGVSLFTVCMLLLLAIEEFSHWLERHWKPWYEVGKRSRDIIRWLFDIK